MKTNEPLRCNRCGCPSVRWMKTRAGKWYLAAYYRETDNPAYSAAMSKVPHKCANHAHHSVAIEEHQAAYYAENAR